MALEQKFKKLYLEECHRRVTDTPLCHVSLCNVPPVICVHLARASTQNPHLIKLC